MDPRLKSQLLRGRWVFVAFAAAGIVFLALEHRAHVLGVLPFVILLACPLMHFFMHGKHGHGGHHGHEEPARPGAPRQRHGHG